ncbi:hypothetical protein X971_5175 (plasmid) [Agrobacterium tumefaciens LBA4213 (Ach5)]|nr:hypothetical protein X971_5175 [Agrobacterium tumefaciens LBA4213 (Ach5)]
MIDNGCEQVRIRFISVINFRPIAVVHNAHQAFVLLHCYSL